jgi:DNA-binding transcriptional LysR family regulator
MLPLVERMVEAGEAIERAKPDFAEDATGTVRVASGPMTIRFIARRLPEMLDAVPGIEIELCSSYSPINLSRREADIALRNRRPEEGRLAMRALPQPSYAVFGAKTYVARHPVAATAARYEECRWIGFDDTRASESLLWLTAKIDARRMSAATPARSWTRWSPAPVSRLPCFLGAEEPALVQLSAPIDDLDREGLWLVLHEDMRNRPRVRLVADRIAALFQRHHHQLQPEGADWVDRHSAAP